ncbi:MAG: glycosyltransferase [Planctomycetota bacterium]
MSQTTATADMRRKQIDAASQAGNPYALLIVAESYLSDVPDDVEVLLLAVRAYIALGLTGAARRLLERCTPPAELHAQLAASIPNAEQRIPWSRFDGQFQDNLKIFDQRTGLAQEVCNVWRQSRHKLQLLVTTSGSYQVFSRLTAAPGWLPCLAPHNQLSSVEKLKSEWSGKVIPPLALNGVGLGYIPRDVSAATRHTLLSYSAPLVVIEPSPLAWAVVLHLFDWRELFAEERISFCAGPEALAQLELLLRDDTRQVPYLLTNSLPWPDGCSDQEITSRLDAALGRHGATHQTLLRHASASYAGRDASWWARRYANAGQSEPPLRVLGITSRFTTVLQYSMRDWLAAYQHHGHDTRLHIELDDYSQVSPIRLLREIESYQPDLVLIIDHLQSESPETYPPNLPGICWIQDTMPHLFNPEAGENVRPLEFVIGQGFPELLTRFAYPPERFYPCLIPTNPQQMVDPDEKPADLEPYRCDVMFATNASLPPEQLYQQRRQLLTDPATRLLDAAYEILMSAVRQPWFRGDYDYAGVLSRAEIETSLRVTTDAIRNHILATLHAIADTSLREQTVRAAAKWASETGGTLHLYGNGWEQRAEFAQYARGFIKHGLPLGRAFRAARISLHAGRNPALHQRVLDGLCAGGFFLIAEKPSDRAHALNQAINTHVQEKALTPPFQLRPADLPEPYASEYRRFLLIRGNDPDEGVTATHEMLMNVRAECEWNCRQTASGVWPRYDEVTYGSPEGLAARIDFFLTHEDERRALAAEMRQAVIERFTYDALVPATLKLMRAGLSGNRGGAESAKDAERQKI